RVHHQPNHHLLVLGRGFGYQQSQRREPHVVDDRLASAQQAAVAVQELDEKEGADALVAVGEGMILDHEIQEVSSLRLDRRIGWLPEHSLIEIAEQGGKPVFTLAAEELGCLAACDQVGLQLTDRATCFRHLGQRATPYPLRLDQQPAVVALQQQERLRVPRDDVHQTAALVASQRLPGGRLAHQGERRFQLASVLLETLSIEGVASDQVLAQDAGCPLAEAYPPMGIDAVSDGDDRVKVVVPDPAVDAATAFGLNYREILGSCRFLQLI